MDFTPELSAFQGAFISADNLHSFARLTSKGGNEEKIKNVIEIISKFLKNEKYMNEIGLLDTMESKTRKFAMYIVLNADLPVLEELIELEGIFLIIWSIPTIPKHLMCELLWNLNMEIFVSEIITYCYPPMALAVAEAFIENFKYFDPTKCLQKLHNFLVACYSLACRLNCFEFEKCNDTLAAIYITLEKGLKYFTNPPNSHRLNTLSKDDLYKYKGERLKTMLLLIFECFNCFTQKVNTSCSNDIYKLTYKEGCFKSNPPTNKVCDCTDPTMMECINNTNTLILDIFKEIVMDVSVDIFCAWSEFEEDGKSMQQNLGELCYKVRSKLVSVNSVSDHPVVDMIQQMARKPAAINDIINSTDTQIILEKIYGNDEDKASWIHALVNKKNLCENADLITIVDSNFEIFDVTECLKLYHVFTTYSKSNTNNNKLIKSVVAKAFHYCNVLDKHRLLQEHFNDKQLQDMADDEEFHNTLTEMFNKFVASSDVNYTEVLNVFLINPREVYKKIFVLATDNSQLTDTMLNIMELLKDYSDYYYVTETEPCIIIELKNILDNTSETNTKRDNLVRFIYGLKNRDILPGTKLLLLVIMPNIHKALLKKDVGQIHVQIQLLREAYTLNQLLEYRAPMLAMLHQVLNILRWRTIRSFIPSAPPTLKLTLDFQISLMATYHNPIPDAECQWLRARLDRKSMQANNYFYFRKVWNNPEVLSFTEAVSGTEVNVNSNRSLLTYCVTQILCSGTLEEWCMVWDDLFIAIEDIEVLCIFHEAMTIIIRAVESTRTPATKACLAYCIQNLVYITRYKYIKEPLTDREAIGSVFGLSKLLKETNQEDVNEIGSRLMPLFAYIAGKKNSLRFAVRFYSFKQASESTKLRYCRRGRVRPPTKSVPAIYYRARNYERGRLFNIAKFLKQICK